ncbi:PIN domain-containing protein [Aequorivita marina]|uniref:PIN domain-containing protein n=1 Tax=Aequorivita marina TaxID=3073654 RepID=UPI002874A498|nr:PIN domain-containing protein [Aequorivita sp. S2608]MDS1297593.1 PIN domain-containing protein [Aequorivita sp. S2608]
MKIVVDTNIIFSAILSPEGTISDLLLNSFETFDFYAPTFVLDELKTHQNKILQISGLSEDDLDFLKRILLKKVTLINVEAFQNKSWQKALELTSNVDEFDTPFIALCIELEAQLWTGDKKLIKGLGLKGIDWLFDTAKMKEIRNKA